MFTSLSLSHFMVFDKALFEFEKGLSVITGETGAGKSTVLNALKILFGSRIDTALIRTGCDESHLSASFSFKNNLFFDNFCEKFDIPKNEEFIIRRILRKNKPNRAYINDMAVTAQTLMEFGDIAAEICGQFEDRDALSPTGFRALLDSYLEDPCLKQDVKQRFTVLKHSETQYLNEKKAIETALKEQDYLRHVLTELDALSPQKGEEDDLAATRHKMMAIEKNMSQLQQVEQSLTYDANIDEALLGALKTLSGLEKEFPDALSGIIADLNEAYEKASLAAQNLSIFNQSLDYDPNLLSTSEERLFALRAAARKHHVSVDDLFDLHRDFTEKLSRIDHGEAMLLKLEKELEIARQDYFESARHLSAARKSVAPELEHNILSHLKDLNLETAQFRIKFEECAPSSEGIESVIFEISSGPSMPFGAVHKTASGGEMSRIMLAIKASLKQNNPEHILIFDEIDRGVGGATAEAVGNKLLELSQKNGQLIVITHSPQVAAKGEQHYHILKKNNQNITKSEMTQLTGKSRHEEIARMLSGAHITDEARAAAHKLF